jgi:hypothetical protein
LILRLSVSPTEPPLAPGQSALTQVWIDNIRFGPTGAPLQAESSAQVAQGVPSLTVGDLTSLIDASRAGWGSFVDAPDGIGGVTPRDLGVAAPDFSFPDGTDRQARNAGINQGGLDNQSFFANLDITSVQSILNDQEARNIGVGSIGYGFSNRTSIADQVGSDSNPSLSTDGHAVQSQFDSPLLRGQRAIIGDAIVDECVSLHSEITDGVAMVDRLPITCSIADFNVSGDFSTQSGDGAIANLEIFNLEKLPFPLFQVLPSVGREGVGLVESNLFFNRTADLAQGENQHSQSSLQHTLSFGSHTLPLERKSVHQVAGNGQWTMVDDGLSNPNSEPCTINHPPVPDGPTWQQVNSHA